MGLSILRAPHTEAAPHQPLKDTPTLEYYPGAQDLEGSGKTTTCRLEVIDRNHRKWEGDSDEIIYGTLEIEGERISDSVGLSFTFKNVRFMDEALHAVWSIRALVYVGGQVSEGSQFKLPGILVTHDPQTPFEPVDKEAHPKPVEYKRATF